VLADERLIRIVTAACLSRLSCRWCPGHSHRLRHSAEGIPIPNLHNSEIGFDWDNDRSYNELTGFENGEIRLQALNGRLVGDIAKGLIWCV